MASTVQLGVPGALGSITAFFVWHVAGALDGHQGLGLCGRCGKVLGVVWAKTMNNEEANLFTCR